jgi:hypothetical protein
MTTLLKFNREERGEVTVEVEDAPQNGPRSLRPEGKTA